MKYHYTGETIRIPDHKLNGKVVRSRREAADVSLRTLAAVMGHSASYQSDLELGKRALPVEKFMQMVAFLEAKR